MGMGPEYMGAVRDTPVRAKILLVSILSLDVVISTNTGEYAKWV